MYQVLVKMEGINIKSTANRFIINYTVRFVSASLFVYSCWIPFQYLGGWFSYHVILCTFGYIPLMAEAIMLFVGDDIWSKNLSRRAKYTVHGILITVATLITIVGNVLVFVYIEPGYHLYTAHGITGLVSMIILIISIILGLAVHYPKSTKRIVSLRPVTFKFLHNISGLMGYGIGIISLCFGYFTDWFKYFNGAESRWVALIFTMAVSLWPLNGAFVSLWNQWKSLLERRAETSPTPSAICSPEII
ncbi:transmembrane reductase CYB561D2-like isoform X2 [Diorhabda carinulata]|uniref:transmembrane reductase CYB561D2-like isoform X2 n=1 Tax=Diorhabda carinulata TaxID=1163345 RepID=UPI0025A159C3|nr:transmembrane reductase CYB561D2-like isoform X2 [Diorhabda carinulata]